jgi:hypothetical protein
MVDGINGGSKFLRPQDWCSETVVQLVCVCGVCVVCVCVCGVCVRCVCVYAHRHTRRYDTELPCFVADTLKELVRK